MKIEFHTEGDGLPESRLGETGRQPAVSEDRPLDVVFAAIFSGDRIRLIVKMMIEKGREID